MNAFVHFPSQLHWTAQDLADAVPLRLHELFAFDADRDGPQATSANAQSRGLRRNRDYLHRTAFPATFHIR